MKKTLRIGLGLSLAVILTSAANATLVTYTWDADTSVNSYSQTANGTLVYDTVAGTVSSFHWIHDSNNNYANTFIGTAALLSNGDLVLSGGNSEFNSVTGTLATWSAGGGAVGSLDENLATSQGPEQYYGDWVNLSASPLGAPVPEPTTIISGALLLLPFGMRTLRILRKKSAAQ